MIGTAQNPANLSRRSLLMGAGALSVASVLGLNACSSDNADTAATAPVSGAPATLKAIVTKHPLTKPMSQMAWVAALEKEANVKIKWEEVSADWPQKRSTMLGAGDVPDLIIGVGAVTDTDLATFGTLFTDMAGDIERMPNVKAMFEGKPEIKAMSTMTDGQVYSIAGYKRFWPDSVIHQYINKQWLDRLGLQVPTTWDELFDVLSAFKREDANGNGDKNDEIPMDWSPIGTDGFGYFQPSVLLGSLGLPIAGGGGQGYFLEDGVVKNFFIDDRYKQVVSFLNRCNSAGLVSKDVMTHDYSQYQSTGRGSKKTAKVGFTWGWTRSDRFGTQIADQYVAMAPLKASADQTNRLTWSYEGWSENFRPGSILVSADTKDRDAALRVVNAFYGQDMSLQVLFGDIGTCIKKVSDKSYEILPPADAKSDPSTWKWTSTLADNGPTWIRDDIEVKLPTDLLEAVEETKPLQPALDSMNRDKDVYPSQFIRMRAEDLNTMALANTTIMNTAMTKFAAWLTKGGIDEQWSSYVDQIKKAGIESNVAVMQRYYDEYMAKK